MLVFLQAYARLGSDGLTAPVKLWPENIEVAGYGCVRSVLSRAAVTGAGRRLSNQARENALTPPPPFREAHRGTERVVHMQPLF